YWGTAIAEHMNKHLSELNDKDTEPTILHLASEEYFKAVDRKALKARVVQCVFQDFKNGSWKVISFNAKRARGLMARYIIENEFTRPEELHSFDRAGYAYAPDHSTPERLMFRRDLSS